MGDQLAAVARVEILILLGAMAILVFYKGMILGPGLASVLTDNPGGPIQSERLVLFLVTLFGAGQYLSQIAQSDGNSLPEVPVALLALFGASNGVYLGAKQFRQPPAPGGG